MCDKLVLITDDEFILLNQEFETWYSHTNNLFSDVKGICRSAIIEFNANKVGKTIYTHRVEK